MTLKEMKERRNAIYAEIQAAKSNEEIDALELEARKLDLMIAEEERKAASAAASAPAASAAAAPPAAAPVPERTAAVNAEIPGVVAAASAPPQASRKKGYDSLEYRKAFMDYVQRGTPIPAEYRDNELTTTTEAAAVIPTTIMNEVIRTLKQYGQVFNRVRKLNVKGGVKIPISSVMPTATWITESAASERKKVNLSTSVTFSYYGLECKIATSLLAEIVTLDVFESTVGEIIAEAMLKALEIGLVSGDGAGEMTGITDAASGVTAVTLSSSDFQQWDSWKKKVFAKLGIRYKAGAVFMMANGTFEGYIDGMVDANGQPIGRLNYGITDGPQERFGGKEVILVEDDVIANYDDASVGDVVAIFGDLRYYAINSNLSMTMYRYLDHDTNQWVDKAILIADGKVLDPKAFLVIKKGA
jgi:HK97 family phage major capsid protein